MWIPADLSSASIVDTSPDATPCGATVCDGIDLSGGSNVLMMSWATVGDGGAVRDDERLVPLRAECRW